MKTKLLLGILCIFFGAKAFADSPLTSTNFNKAYQEMKIIQKAAAAQGELTPQLLKYLLKKGKPLEVKMALINELGWDFNGKSNALLFEEYLLKKRKLKNYNELTSNVNAEELICLAYLKALDDYFQVNQALALARRAKAKASDSYTVNIICALIEAQKALHSDQWCKVYKLTDEVRNDTSLSLDMKKEASDIIFDYMDIYKADCE